jgi:hypothetical protein
VTVKSGKGNIRFFAGDIRGALVWPTPKSLVSYYCIFAQKEEMNLEGKASLVLLGEYAAELPGKLFKHLLEDAQRFAVRDFYANILNHENWELTSLFNDHRRYHQASHVRLVQAPLANNFPFAIGLLQEFAHAGALEVHEGILHDQLKRISTKDLSENPEETFFAIRAASFAIAGFERSPRRPDFFGRGNARTNLDRKDPRGWT